MAHCYNCGNDAGYLKSLCQDCKAVRPEFPPAPASTCPASRERIRLDPLERGDPMSPWLKVILAVLVLLFFVVLLIFSNWLATPDNEIWANKLKRICLEHMAPNDPAACERVYQDALEKGRPK